MRFRKSMAVLVVLALLASIPSSAFADAYVDGVRAGRRDGANYESHAFGWSFFWGFLFSIGGAAGSVAYYRNSSPNIGDTALARIEGKGRAYRTGYLEAYEDAAKETMVSEAWLGAAAGFGTGTLATIAIASTLPNNDGPTPVPIMSVSW